MTDHGPSRRTDACSRRSCAPETRGVGLSCVLPPAKMSTDVREDVRTPAFIWQDGVCTARCVLSLSWPTVASFKEEATERGGRHTTERQPGSSSSPIPEPSQARLQPCDFELPRDAGGRSRASLCRAFLPRGIDTGTLHRRACQKYFSCEAMRPRGSPWVGMRRDRSTALVWRNAASRDIMWCKESKGRGPCGSTPRAAESIANQRHPKRPGGPACGTLLHRWMKRERSRGGRWPRIITLVCTLCVADEQDMKRAGRRALSHSFCAVPALAGVETCGCFQGVPHSEHWVTVRFPARS